MTSLIVIRKSFWNAAQALGMHVNRKKNDVEFVLRNELTCN